MLDAEVAKGRVGMAINPLYAHLEGSETVGPIDFNLTANLFLVEFGIFYRFGPYALGSSPGTNKSVALLPVIGGRYTHIKSELNLGERLEAEGSEDWVDPIVGIRTKWTLSERWSLGLTGNK
jgi:hypothetical protein